MAFDKSQPEDTTKIRNLGVVIRPNWVAIEEADSSFKPYAINLISRNTTGASNDPSTIASTSILFCKNDTAGNPELHHRGAAGNIIQMSYGGRMGGPETDLTMNKFRFGTSAVNYSVNSVVSSAISWTASGSTVSSFRCSQSKIATGVYRVTFSTARTSLNYYVQATLSFSPSSSTAVCLKVTNKELTYFDVETLTKDLSAVNEAVYCVVFGGF